MEKIKWPNGARCAVMLSFDVDGETLFRSGPPGADWAWPRSVSHGRYGPHRGLERILDMLKRQELKATFYVPAATALRYPESFCRIDAEGHEIGHHGFYHELFSDYTYEEQKDILLRSQEVFDRLIGKKVLSFRTPSGDFSEETPKLLHDLGFLFTSSMYGDDRPYLTVIDGKETDLIEIPAKWELDDYPQFGYDYYPADPQGLDRIDSHRSTLDNWIREFDGYYKYGLCYVLMCHPQLSGMPGRVQMLEKLIAHIRSYPDVWFATGSEIARWWLETY